MKSCPTGLSSRWVERTVSSSETKAEAERGSQDGCQARDCAMPAPHLAKKKMKVRGFVSITECRKMFLKGASSDAANKVHVFLSRGKIQKKKSFICFFGPFFFVNLISDE